MRLAFKIIIGIILAIVALFVIMIAVVFIVGSTSMANLEDGFVERAIEIRELNDAQIIDESNLQANLERMVLPTLESFEDCIAAGNPAMESHPRQCRTEDGQHFVEILEQIVCPQGFEPVDGVCPDNPVVESTP